MWWGRSGSKRREGWDISGDRLRQERKAGEQKVEQAAGLSAEKQLWSVLHLRKARQKWRVAYLMLRQCSQVLVAVKRSMPTDGIRSMKLSRQRMQPIPVSLDYTVAVTLLEDLGRC